MLTPFRNLINIGLRFGTLGVRFLFVFFLAKYLDTSSVGYYGIFTATVGYTLYFVGLDYYVYVTREIKKAPQNERGLMLKSQAALSGMLYLLLMPLAFLFLNNSDWPGHLIWWFLPILVFEHINQELCRLLIVLSEQITASLILFVRQGSWAIAIVALMYWQPASRNLDMVMLLWACAGVCATALGVMKVKSLHLGGWRDTTDWRWVRKGVAISGTFLIATLSLRGIQTFDRYWLQDLAGIEVVGAYVLFFGVASALMVFLDAGIFSFIYPELIDHSHNDRNDLARAKVRVMLFQAVAISLVFAVISVVALPYLLAWIGKALYTQEMYLYFWILAAVVLNAIGMVPHYALYARGHDRPIVASHIAALPIFGLSTWILIHIDAALAVPAGVCIAFAVVLCWKTIAYLNVIRGDDRPMAAPQS